VKSATARRLSNLVVYLFLAEFLYAPRGYAYIVDIDTPPLSVPGVAMAFDFVDGGPPSNSVTVSSFSTNGTLGPVTSTGGVVGSLPNGFTLSDSTFFNEYLQNVSGATNIAFAFQATSNAAATDSLPDTFSFYLLDPITGLPLFSTTDPTGADSLFTFQITGASLGLIENYSPLGLGTPAPWTVIASVPEPSALVLLVIGLGLALLYNCHVRMHGRKKRC